MIFLMIAGLLICLYLTYQGCGLFFASVMFGLFMDVSGIVLIAVALMVGGGAGAMYCLLKLIL
jgi:hypothetical protein